MGKKLTATIASILGLSVLSQINSSNPGLKLSATFSTEGKRELSFLMNVLVAPADKRIKRDYDVKINLDSLSGQYLYSHLREVTETIEEIEIDLPKLYNPLLWSFDGIVFKEGIIDSFCANGKFFVEKVPGTVSHKDDRAIYLDPRLYSFGVLARESVRARNKLIGWDFDGKWIELVDENVVYESGLKSDSPLNGFIDIRGAKRCATISHNAVKKYGYVRWHHDPAYFVSELYVNGFGRYRNIDPNDKRYARKLELLLEYDFISDKQFEGAMEILGQDFKRELAKLP